MQFYVSPKNSDSFESKKFRQFLQHYSDGKYADSFVQYDPDTDAFLIVVPAKVEHFSPKAQSMMKSKVESEFGKTLRISYAGVELDPRITSAVEGLLEPVLKENLISVSMGTSDPNTVSVFIYVNSVPRGRKGSRIQEILEIYLLELGYSLSQFYLAEPSNGVPSLYKVLEALYEAAPSDKQSIFNALRNKQLFPPSINWLSRQLDSLVRQGLVMWQVDGQYALTQKGISRMPARNGLSPPDIRRILVLGRKKW